VIEATIDYDLPERYAPPHNVTFHPSGKTLTVRFRPDSEAEREVFDDIYLYVIERISDLERKG